MSTNENLDWDVIVIGSGAGGLSAAVALANAGQRVLVLEQHTIAGGLSHSFSLQGYTFSPGVHYIGGLQPGGALNAVYRGLGVSGDLAFCELNPDAYDHIIAGGKRFDIPKGRAAYIERLKARFPADARGIERIFASIQRIMDGIKVAAQMKTPLDAALLPFRAWDMARWFWGNTQAFVDAHVSDPFLKAILLSQAGNNGVPPSRVSPVIHAAMMDHYFEGSYFPLGGGFAIARAFVRALRRKGGEIRLKTPVKNILVERGRAIGVRLADGTEIRARVVVSNADPEVTLGRLVGREHLSGRMRRKLDRTVYSASVMILFCAVDMDLRSAGMDSGNVWWYRHNDIDRTYRQGMGDANLGPSPIEAMFMAATTLKDPSKMHSGHHTLEAFASVGYDGFKKWETRHASGDYSSFKEGLTDKLFDTLEEIVPGIRQHVVFAELGTPLAMRHFANTTGGSIYGIEKTANQVGPWAYPVKTEIGGLYMVGASTLSQGVAGVTASGLAAAQAILGCEMGDLLAEDGPEVAIYQSEDVSKWPQELRDRIKRKSTQAETDDPLAEISGHRAID